MRLPSSRPVLLLASLAMLAAVGCTGVGAQGPENGGQQLPFTGGKPVVVPENTIVYVRLHQGISAATAQTGQTFTAALDEPLLVDNQTIVPQGAEATGKVVAARESGRLHTAGYVRITLCSITVNGKVMAMQTNSAMAGGGSFKNRDLTFLRGGEDRWQSRTFQAGGSSGGSASRQAGFDPDQRIGFRLTQPLNIN